MKAAVRENQRAGQKVILWVDGWETHSAGP